MTNPEQPYDKVDPAALLVAVLAASLTPILQPGAWGPVSSISALIIAAIVFCFTWPHDPQLPRRVDRWIIAAQSLTFGMITSIAAAWFVQSGFVMQSNTKFYTHYSIRDCILVLEEDCAKEVVKQHFDLWGTLLGIVVGLAVASFAFWGLSKRTIDRYNTAHPNGDNSGQSDTTSTCQTENQQAETDQVSLPTPAARPPAAPASSPAAPPTVGPTPAVPPAAAAQQTQLAEPDREAPSTPPPPVPQSPEQPRSAPPPPQDEEGPAPTSGG